MQHEVERLRECCSKKKDEIASMMEKTSQLKQMKEDLKQSMSLVCSKWEVLLLLSLLSNTFEQYIDENFIPLQGKSFPLFALPSPIYAFLHLSLNSMLVISIEPLSWGYFLFFISLFYVVIVILVFEFNYS